MFAKIQWKEVVMIKDWKIKIFLLLFYVNSLCIFSDEYVLQNIPIEFTGTYIPVQYDNILKSTRNHFQAMLSNKRHYHDILLLDNDQCRSNAGFHDGYAIQKSEFKDFSFVSNSNGKFIIDNNGNSYRRISETIGYDEFEKYVIDVIFEDAQSLKNIVLNRNKVVINNVEYSINLDSTFFETTGVSIWLYANRKFYALRIQGISAKLYEAERDEVSVSVSDTIISEFPMFYWNEKNYPEILIWNMSQMDLRYIRNLIYAKHGYIFKSEELRTIYENFTWYNRNFEFSEGNFTNNEKQLLENIQRRENGQ